MGYFRVTIDSRVVIDAWRASIRLTTEQSWIWRLLSDQLSNRAGVFFMNCLFYFAILKTRQLTTWLTSVDNLIKALLSDWPQLKLLHKKFSLCGTVEERSLLILKTCGSNSVIGHLLWTSQSQPFIFGFFQHSSIFLYLGIKLTTFWSRAS